MITIDKAIKNLTAGREDSGMIPEEEYTQTIDIATEALKVIDNLRFEGSPFYPSELPGETKE